MLIELNYMFFSILLVIYSAWRYFKRKEKGLLYLTVGFLFLVFSAVLQILHSLSWGIQSIEILRLLELGGLAFFACFAITTIIAILEISKTAL